MKALTTYLIALLTLVGLSGCGTINSVTHAGKTSPIVYSGTRLDSAALTDNQDELKKFEVAPPKYPAVDFAGSFMLDTALLPGTLMVAAFRKVAW